MEDSQWTIGSLVLYDFEQWETGKGRSLCLIIEAYSPHKSYKYLLKPLFSADTIEVMGLGFVKKLAQFKLGEDQTIIGIESAGPFEVAPDPGADV